MTNKEWLDYLAQNAPDELSAWFDAEHVENQERALDGDTESENEDSRELLEAEIRRKQREWSQSPYALDTNVYEVIGWLDRQAAITEEQTRCKWVTASADEIAAWRSKAEKLKEQVYELTAESDNLAADLMRANNERDHYREKFGKCLDYADAIHALMDDEGLA